MIGYKIHNVYGIIKRLKPAIYGQFYRIDNRWKRDSAYLRYRIDGLKNEESIILNEDRTKITKLDNKYIKCNKDII
jgi:hypothetical protein